MAALCVTARCPRSCRSALPKASWPPQDSALGLIQAPRYHLESDLAAGSLVTVLDDYPPTPTPVSLLYPQRRQLSPRVRVFIEWVSQVFSAGA